MFASHSGAPRVVLFVEGDSVGMGRQLETSTSGRDEAVLRRVRHPHQAMEALEREPVVLVVVAKDGFAEDALGGVCRRLKASPFACPIALLAREECVPDAATYGADYDVALEDAASAIPLLVTTAIGTADLAQRVAISEREYYDLIDASNDAIYILTNGRFRYVNPPFAELFGFSAKDLTATNFDYFQLVHPDSRPLVAARSERVDASEPLPTRYEFKAVRQDGSAFDAEVSVSYITRQGQPAVLGIIQDITARKTYEKALLRKNHELSVLNAVAEAVNQGQDLASILEGVVERMIELLGVDAAGISLLSENRTDRFKSVHFRGTSETFLREMQERDPRSGVFGLALAKGKLQIIEDIGSDARIEHGAAAREGFHSAVALPLESVQRVSGVVTIFTRSARTFSEADVQLFMAVARQLAVALESARLFRKASEGIARLRALSEIARAIGSTLDVEGVFRIVAERLQDLVAYRQVSLLIMRTDRERLSVRSIDRPPPGAVPVVRLEETIRIDEHANFQRVLDTRETQQLEEAEGPAALVPIVADDVPLGVFVVRGEAVKNHSRFRRRDLDLLGDLAAHMAISLKNARVFEDLERAYRELRDAKDRLVRSEKLQGLGEMAAGVAHDFNNVLSAILGRAQMLKVLSHDEQVQKSVAVIESAALDGAGTVRRIQEFAKAKPSQDLVRVFLNPLTRATVERCMTRVESDRVDLQVHLARTGPVMGHPGELREVLTNLIYNALDAMPHGGRLAVRTGRDELRGHDWFEVEDTGVGMDEEVQKKIFDPFFTTKGARGTGLGMSVSYGIIQRHGGEIEVVSRRGEGTKIRIRLASVSAEAVLPPPAMESSDIVVPQEPLLEVDTDVSQRPRILVIDDDVAVREVLADILRTEAYEVVAVGSGREGLDRFEGERFDAVFTDLGMPGMDGWEVVKGIKSQAPDTPVGLITGWGASLEETDLQRAGVDVIVSKPFRLEQVIDTVKEALRRGR